MRNPFLASTCEKALAAFSRHAEPRIGAAAVAPVFTSTIEGCTADQIRIASAVSVKPSSGYAVPINQIYIGGEANREEQCRRSPSGRKASISLAC